MKICFRNFAALWAVLVVMGLFALPATVAAEDPTDSVSFDLTDSAAAFEAPQDSAAGVGANLPRTPPPPEETREGVEDAVRRFNAQQPRQGGSAQRARSQRPIIIYRDSATSKKWRVTVDKKLAQLTRAHDVFVQRTDASIIWLKGEVKGLKDSKGLTPAELTALRAGLAASKGGKSSSTSNSTPLTPGGNASEEEKMTNEAAWIFAAILILGFVGLGIILMGGQRRRGGGMAVFNPPIPPMGMPGNPTGGWQQQQLYHTDPDGNIVGQTTGMVTYGQPAVVQQAQPVAAPAPQPVVVQAPPAQVHIVGIPQGYQQQYPANPQAAVTPPAAANPNTVPPVAAAGQPQIVTVSLNGSTLQITP